jgi:hypothetical protein
VVVAVVGAADARAAARNEDRPRTPGLDALVATVDLLPFGVALLTRDRRTVHVNTAGREFPEIDCSDTPVDVQGQRLIIRVFRDVTEACQRTRGSALLGFVHEDAAHLAEHIRNSGGSRRSEPADIRSRQPHP